MTKSGYRHSRLVVTLITVALAIGACTGSAARPPTGKGSLRAPIAHAAFPLRVHAPASMAGYSRAQFGPAWTDAQDAALGRNGCTTRDDVLRRDLQDVQLRPGSTCIVASGVLVSPYNALTIHFVRGVQTSGAVQIDHVVSLGDAWRTGASAWTPDRRREFANDPLNLLAVDGADNEIKSDQDASTWLPPNVSFRCTYVRRQQQVKLRYQLWVTDAEQTAMQVACA